MGVNLRLQRECYFQARFKHGARVAFGYGQAASSMRDTSLIELSLLLLACGVAIASPVRLRLPPMLGYLSVGFIMACNGVNLTAADDHIRGVAELGVVALMFTLGLEFSLTKLLASGAQAFGAGCLQVGITTAMVVAGALMGLAAPSGAFVAGMVAGESDFRYRFEGLVRPLRNALLGLFFISVGMQIEIKVLVGEPVSVLQWLLLFLIVKTAIIVTVAKLLRCPVSNGIRIAIIFAHGGEFAWLLLMQAMRNDFVVQTVAQPAAMALALSMSIAPILVQQHVKIAHFVEGLFLVHIRAEEPLRRSSVELLSHHVLLCGFGSSGRLMAITLDTAKLSYIAMEVDDVRFDAGHEEVIIDQASVARAKLVVLTFERRSELERIAHDALGFVSRKHSLRSRTDEHAAISCITGRVSMSFPQDLAAGLELARESLRRSGFKDKDARQALAAVRKSLCSSDARAA